MEKLKRNLLPKKEAIRKIDCLTQQKKDYFFVADFEGENFLVYQLEEAHLYGLYFDFEGITNYTKNKQINKNCIPHFTNIFPIDRQEYRKAFARVQSEINYGNTYLLNLTFPSRVSLPDDCDLEDIFVMSKAPFKVWLQDEFVCFSPEPFILIDYNQNIYTYPMKGTIDANISNAREMLLYDKKEVAEHYTIVDLLRNDMSIVSDCVEVKKFRFFEKIHTNKGSIWQTSSEIKGVLKKEYIAKYGSVLSAMLPAGSISGAPKQKTVEIIKDTEIVSRGFYTGVAGLYYNGVLKSSVMIRFIAKWQDDYFYHSGGGITADSVCEKEYNEMLKKVYIPL